MNGGFISFILILMLKAKGLEKSFGPQLLFNDASLTVGDAVKAGLVGVNGSGKSSLLKILAGEDNDYKGEVSYETKHPLIGYMHQQISISHSEKTLEEFLKEYVGIKQAEDQVNELMTKLEDPEYMDQYSDAYELFEKMGGYTFNSTAEETLAKLGLSKYDLNVQVKKLSGGEKNKLLLCATLLKGGDILLLDEPTNNLDSKSIGGLINYIQSSLASCLIISHDRDFLNQTVSKIFEIDGEKKNISEFGGNYDTYEEEKYRQLYNQSVAYNSQQEEIKRLQDTIQEKKQWAAKGAYATRSDNDKGARNSAREKAEKSNKTAKGLEQRIEQMEKIERPAKKRPIELTLESAELPYGDIEITNLQYQYPDDQDFRLSLEHFTIKPKDKLLIAGDNGQGKSTFIKLLIKELEANSGIINIHTSIKLGYFSQEHHHLERNETPVEYLRSQGDFTEQEVNHILAKIGFKIDDRNKKIALLSPGMKSRLTFALISLKKYNCLVFDEPTNHVDIETIEELEEAINGFDGISIVVTHDKKFIEHIKFNKKLIFKEGKGQEGSM